LLREKFILVIELIGRLHQSKGNPESREMLSDTIRIPFEDEDEATEELVEIARRLNDLSNRRFNENLNFM
jgi:hypothetical protein